MSRFFLYAAVLLPVGLIAALGSSLLVFRHADLTFTAFAGLVMAPLLQATVLAWNEGAPGSRLAAAAHRVLSAPLARPVVLLDALMIGGGLLAWSSPRLGLGADVTIQPAWAAIKGTVAAVLLVAVRPRSIGRTPRVAAAGMSLALAAAAFVPWPLAASGAAGTALHVPGIAARMLVDGALIAAAIAITLACARTVDSVSPQVAVLYRCAAAAAIACGAVDALAAFNHRDVVQPWIGLLTLSATLAATSLLLAAVLTNDP